MVALDGCLLDPHDSLEFLGLEDEDCWISVICQEAQVAATGTAFVVCGGDTVEAWGHPDNGGDARKVLSALRNVSEVQATRRAFAIRSRDGCVVTWGDVESGGDCSEVQDQLRNVEALQSSLGAFAALKEGTIITWGDKETGGDSSHVQEQLRDVQYVQATHFAFAAITSAGGVVTWGDPVRGGDSSGVQDQLYDIQPLGEADPVSSASGWPFSSKQQEISLRQIHGLWHLLKILVYIVFMCITTYNKPMIPGPLQDFMGTNSPSWMTNSRVTTHCSLGLHKFSLQKRRAKTPEILGHP